MDMFGNGPVFIMGLVLGTVGLGYFMYGKKAQKALPLACGLGLMVFPYFVSDMTWLIVAGSALGVVPWIVR